MKNVNGLFAAAVCLVFLGACGGPYADEGSEKTLNDTVATTEEGLIQAPAGSGITRLNDYHFKANNSGLCMAPADAATKGRSSAIMTACTSSLTPLTVHKLGAGYHICVPNSIALSQSSPSEPVSDPEQGQFGIPIPIIVGKCLSASAAYFDRTVLAIMNAGGTYQPEPWRWADGGNSLYRLGVGSTYLTNLGTKPGVATLGANQSWAVY